MRFPTERPVTRFGNDGDFCIRPVKVSPESHWLVSYAFEKIIKTNRVAQEDFRVIFRRVLFVLVACA